MKTQTIFMILFATTVAAKPITPFKVWYCLYINGEKVSTFNIPKSKDASIKFGTEIRPGYLNGKFTGNYNDVYIGGL